MGQNFFDFCWRFLLQFPGEAHISKSFAYSVHYTKVPGCFHALSFSVGGSATMYFDQIKLTLELYWNLTFAVALAKITRSYYFCTASSTRHLATKLHSKKKSHNGRLRPANFLLIKKARIMKKNQIAKLTCSGILRLDHLYKAVE